MVRTNQVPFHIHVRIRESEIELKGTRKEVISTLDELDWIVEKFSKAFNIGHQSKAQISDNQRAQRSNTKFPTIPRTTKCGEAVIALLSTEWGKTPRTISELREAMEANAVFYPKTPLSGVLVWLVKKAKIRRWKNKKRGYLYTLNGLERVL